MNGENKTVPSNSRTAGRWKVVSEPGAAIHVEVLQMTDEMRRGLTADGVEYLPPPNLERFRRFWRLPKKG
jgi:hypothetical protein